MPFLGSTPVLSSGDGNFGSTITIGDGTAEDIMIKFDGNAVDYHIGVDDSADTLNFGKGSTLGTTTSQTFDTNGIIQRPLQTSFFINGDASFGPSNQNLAKDVYRTESMGDEIFDTNADFDTTNDTFTAPVTGLYLLSANVSGSGFSSHGRMLNHIVTSNRTYIQTAENLANTVTSTSFGFSVTCLADMDANDTVTMRVFASRNGASGATTTSGNSSEPVTFFSGFLLG